MMMGNYFIKMLLFSVAVLMAYVWLSYSIPQKVSLPPKKEDFDPSKITTQADVVKVGQELFFGKGQCALCHSIGPSHAARCPDLEGIGGKLKREFIYESLTQPDAYIYKDYHLSPPKAFPAKMPAINKPPVDLSEPEMLAVIAFTQKLGGEVTVQPEEFLALLPKTAVQGDAGTGRNVYQRMACGECHESNLPALISVQDDMRLADLIIEPTAVRRGGERAAEIHKDFDRKLSVKDLKDLTAYLLTLKR
jgi:mono/diheme cytochrome c family protein